MIAYSSWFYFVGSVLVLTHKIGRLSSLSSVGYSSFDKLSANQMVSYSLYWIIIYKYVRDTHIKFGKDPVDYFDRQFFSDSDYMASNEGVTSNDEL
jgi:hypothetical protein